jgi:hypothetical protein
MEGQKCSFWQQPRWGVKANEKKFIYSADCHGRRSDGFDLGT